MSNDWQDKNILIVGGGVTGRALAEFFMNRGARVTLSDQRSTDQLPELKVMCAAGLVLDLGGHTTERFVASDLIVISPGVNLELPAIVAARAAGVPVWGEIEVAARVLTAPMVAITGTNGKSTTTSVAGEIFSAWGKRTFIGGNLGIPLISAAAQTDWEWLVVELSSFQLEAIDQYRPRYAALLNITEDHLDRYPDMTSYVEAKKRIFENQQADDVAILNAEDELVLEAAKGCRARKVLFSSTRVLEEGMGFDGSHLIWRQGGNEVRFAAAELKLQGLHNVENVMAALIPALLEGCPADLAWRAACGFGGLDHRMVKVRELNGVVWYNDSKGTNVGSVVKSLAGLSAPVTLIAGGKDKGGDYAPLRDLIHDKVGHLILIGQAAERMAQSFAGLTDIRRAATLPEAVQLAHQLTPAGGAVLLSPGCSSFDMFSSYGERGDVFARAVMALSEKEAV